MNKNSIFLAFFGVFFLIFLYFSVTAAYKLYLFNIQSNQTNATEVNWSIVKLSAERYALQAEYDYVVDDQTRKGKTHKYLTYRNAWAAKQALAAHADQSWTVWYSKSHSTLEKRFPLKESVYCGVMGILLIYFIWLGFYVGNYDRNTAKKRH